MEHVCSICRFACNCLQLLAVACICSCVWLFASCLSWNGAQLGNLEYNLGAFRESSTRRKFYILVHYCGTPCNKLQYESKFLVDHSMSTFAMFRVLGFIRIWLHWIWITSHCVNHNMGAYLKTWRRVKRIPDFWVRPFPYFMCLMIRNHICSSRITICTSGWYSKSFIIHGGL